MNKVYIIQMSNNSTYVYFSDEQLIRGKGQAKAQVTKGKDRYYGPKSFEIWYADEKDPLCKIEEYP